MHIRLHSSINLISLIFIVLIVLVLSPLLLGFRSEIAVDRLAGNIRSENYILGHRVSTSKENESELFKLYQEYGLTLGTPVWERTHHYKGSVMTSRRTLGEELRAYQPRMSDDDMRGLLEAILLKFSQQPDTRFLYLHEVSSLQHLELWDEVSTKPLHKVPLHSE